MARRRVSRVVGLCWLSALIGGCSAGGNVFSTPVASFGASSIFSPSGYSQTRIDDTHYQVKATGTEATPKTRIEKIARARAAEIGVEQHFNFFKVTSVQHTVTCEKRKDGYKSSATPAGSWPIVVIDVVYAKEASDPAFVSSAETLTALKSELNSDMIHPEDQAVAIQETRAGCG